MRISSLLGKSGQHDEPDFTSDFCRAGFGNPPGIGSSGRLPEGGEQDPAGSAAATVGGHKAAETPAAEVRSQTGSPVAGSDFDGQLTAYQGIARMGEFGADQEKA